MTMDLVLAGIPEKQPFLRFAEKHYFGQKSIFPKKTSKICYKTDIILEMVTILFAQPCLVVAEHG